MLESGIKTWFTPWTGSAQCVGHTYMSITFVFFMCVVYVLIVYAWWWSWLQLSCHVKVDGVVVGSRRRECMSIMHLLCMLVSIRNYAYIDMVIVFVHEIMVCGWYGHALITG